MNISSYKDDISYFSETQNYNFLSNNFELRLFFYFLHIIMIILWDHSLNKVQYVIWYKIFIFSCLYLWLNLYNKIYHPTISELSIKNSRVIIVMLMIALLNCYEIYYYLKITSENLPDIFIFLISIKMIILFGIFLNDTNNRFEKIERENYKNNVHMIFLIMLVIIDCYEERTIYNASTKEMVLKCIFIIPFQVLNYYLNDHYNLSLKQEIKNIDKNKRGLESFYKRYNKINFISIQLEIMSLLMII